jgi:hypothetical protein
MAKKNISLDEMREKRHVDVKRVQKLCDSILAESRAVRLAEFRKSLELTQIDIA